MTGNIFAKTRTIAIRAAAVVTVVLMYAVGGIGTQVATTAGVSTLALTALAAPARAGWRRGWGRDPGWRGWGWRRDWHRCWWGDWCYG